MCDGPPGFHQPRPVLSDSNNLKTGQAWITDLKKNNLTLWWRGTTTVATANMLSGMDVFFKLRMFSLFPGVRCHYSDSQVIVIDFYSAQTCRTFQTKLTKPAGNTGNASLGSFFAGKLHPRQAP